MVTLTQLDRQNIDALARIYDSLNGGPKYSRAHSNTIIYERDKDQLVQYGFSFGVTGASMFGVDKLGRTWQVTNVPTHKNKRGGSFSTTTWYLVDERGLRHKMQPVGWISFYGLFGKDGEENDDGNDN